MWYWTASLPLPVRQGESAEAGEHSSLHPEPAPEAASGVAREADQAS